MGFSTVTPWDSLTITQWIQRQSKQWVSNAEYMGGQPGHASPSQSNTLRKPVASKQAPTEFTVAVYTFSHEKGEPMPYRIKIPSKNVSLRQVKEFLPKKGAFRFTSKLKLMVTCAMRRKLKTPTWFLFGKGRSWFSVACWIEA
eukprot:TRINITY_DN37317_c0_g1_i1.p1 TRINITY_DN37317_c0_g1~~TRINITY_DN37317_c0_g1_i1.p1  ORF type:complete len:143 (+),score=24.69 TRINITY_DN37317_c0_g1_i1:3-431(+)